MSDQTDRHTPIRVADVFEGDAHVDGSSGHELRCTPDAVHFDGPDQTLSIPHAEVAAVRVDVDASVAGFSTIGSLFAVVAVFMAVVFAQVLTGPGPLVSVPGLGSLFSGVLAAGGAVWMHRLDVGERRVLRLDCTDGTRTEFITDDDNGAFDAIRARIDAAD